MAAVELPGRSLDVCLPYHPGVTKGQGLAVGAVGTIGNCVLSADKGRIER